MESWKDNISFILIEPMKPGNIGASAHAMESMGFERLELVKPMECAHRLRREQEITDDRPCCVGQISSILYGNFVDNSRVVGRRRITLNHFTVPCSISFSLLIYRLKSQKVSIKKATKSKVFVAS